MTSFEELRRAVWHLRHDGVRGLAMFDLTSGGVLPHRLANALYQRVFHSLPDSAHIRTSLIGHTGVEREDYYRHVMKSLVGEEPEVTVLLITNRPVQLRPALRQIARQRGVTLHTVVVTHGFEASEDVHAYASELPVDAMFVSAPAEHTLGECYNLALKYVHTELIAKCDDDDYYGPYFLLEQTVALQDSDASVVGKSNHGIVFRHGGQVRYGMRRPGTAGSWVKLVSGATMVMRTQTAREFGFANVTSGEDTDFQKRILDAGGLIYSTSEFGFVQGRLMGNHTWGLADMVPGDTQVWPDFSEVTADDAE